MPRARMRLQMRACDAPLCVPCYAQLMPPCRPRVKQLRLPGTVLAATHGGDVTIAADSMLIQAALPTDAGGHRRHRPGAPGQPACCSGGPLGCQAALQAALMLFRSPGMRISRSFAYLGHQQEREARCEEPEKLKGLAISAPKGLGEGRERVIRPAPAKEREYAPVHSPFTAAAGRAPQYYCSGWRQQRLSRLFGASHLASSLYLSVCVAAADPPGPRPNCSSACRPQSPSRPLASHASPSHISVEPHNAGQRRAGAAGRRQRQGGGTTPVPVARGPAGKLRAVIRGCWAQRRPAPRELAGTSAGAAATTSVCQRPARPCFCLSSSMWARPESQRPIRPAAGPAKPSPWPVPIRAVGSRKALPAGAPEAATPVPQPPRVRL